MMAETSTSPRRADRRDERTDEDLVAACAGGGVSELEELFERHGGRIHRILARLGFVAARDLDDMVQATFLEVQRSALRFDRRASAATWIAGIAMNLARHHARGEARRRSAMAKVADDSATPAWRWPDEQAAHRQFLARLQSGYDELPQGLRTVFALCDLEGMRGVDAARVLGVPEGTVWRRLHQARLRLRACLDADASEG